MQRQDEGHPLAATLLLFSMFAFAFVFHAVTRPVAMVAAHYQTTTIALRAPIAAKMPIAEPSRPMARAASIAFRATPEPESAAPSLPGAVPALDTASWPVLAALPEAIVPAPVSPLKNEAGAVTRALSQTRSAMRSAFKKAF